MAAEVRVSPTMDDFWILLSMLRVKVGQGPILLAADTAVSYFYKFCLLCPVFLSVLSQSPSQATLYGLKQCLKGL